MIRWWVEASWTHSFVLSGFSFIQVMVILNVNLMGAEITKRHASGRVCEGISRKQRADRK